MDYDLLIKNGTAVIPNIGVKEMDIGVKDGRISGIFLPNCEIKAREIINADGLYVFPGVIDPHVHYGFYQTLEEDFLIQTQAAARGGITSIIIYFRGRESYFEYAPWLIKTGESRSLIDFAFSFGLLSQRHLRELPEIVDTYGITSFKFYRNYQDKLGQMFDLDDPLNYDADDLLRIIRMLKAISPRLTLCVHCENADLLKGIEKKLEHIKRDDTLQSFAESRPGYLEADSVIQTAYLNKIAGGNVYIVHLSSKEGVEILQKMPSMTGNGLTVETGPHYLLLNEKSKCGLLAKVMPPVHTESDSEMLWEGIKSGLIQTLGSDNNPSNLAEKVKMGRTITGVLPAFPNAGIILPALLSEGYHKRGISLERIAALSSHNAARALGLDGKGRMDVGADADFAIVDIDLEKTVSADTFADGDYSVYEGMRLKGWPVYTISRGEIIFENGNIVGSSGRGNFIKRQA